MIFTFALCIGVMAAGAAAQPVESSGNSEDLDMMKMVEVNETLVVYKRKHSNKTMYRCLSAKKEQRVNETQFQYKLRGREYGVYKEYSVNVALVKLSEASSGYMSTYTDKGCEVLVPVSQVNKEIPYECDKYYKTKCHGKNFKPHKKNCRYN